MAVTAISMSKNVRNPVTLHGQSACFTVKHIDTTSFICSDVKRRIFSKFQSSQAVSYHGPCGRMSKFKSQGNP